MLTVFVALLGGWFAHAGWLHCRARLDYAVLAFLRDRPSQTTWYWDVERSGVGGPFLSVRFRRLVRQGLVSKCDPFAGYCITELGHDWLRVEQALAGDL